MSADVTLLYSIADPVKVAKEFGWGTLYVQSFVINTFQNGVLTTLGKMNAESFYDEAVRIAAVARGRDDPQAAFAERGFRVEKLLLRSYAYGANYEKSLHDKKVAVQLAEKNRKESLVNEEKAKLRQIESKGNASITIAESEVNARISKIRAEAELYSSQVRAKGDKEVNVAGGRGEAAQGRRAHGGGRALRRRARDREDVRQHRGRRHDARAVHRVHPQRVGRHRREPRRAAAGGGREVSAGAARGSARRSRCSSRSRSRAAARRPPRKSA